MTDATYATQDRLYHFVGRSEQTDDGRYNLLVNTILAKQSLRHPPFTDDGSCYGYRLRTTAQGWIGSLLHEKQGPPPGDLIFDNIICFADIPKPYLAPHMQHYSQFGLGFGKTYLAQRGARPVMYYPYWTQNAFASLHGATSLAELSARLADIAEHRTDLPAAFERDFMLGFLAYLKPFHVGLPLQDPSNHYMEREWRKIGYLDFALDDVAEVILPQRYVDQFACDVPQLACRVTTVEQL